MGKKRSHKTVVGILFFIAMGRVARYKKIKAFDPYSKKNNGRIDLEKVGIWGMGDDVRKVKKVSKTVQKIRARRNNINNNNKKLAGTNKHGEGRRRAPHDDAHVLDAEYGEDDFDLDDMVGSLKKEAPPALEPAQPVSARLVTVSASSNLASSAKSSSPVAAEASASTKPSQDGITSSEVEEERLMRRLMLAKPAAPTSSSQSASRMPGESKEAYKRRSALEVRRILRQNRMEKLNPDKRRRKKEFLNNKKKKKGGGGEGSSQHPARDDDGRRRYNDEDGDDDDVSLSDRRTETRVVFGEQVEAPPVFRQRPRGVQSSRSAVAAADKTSSKRRLATPQDIDAEQEAMEQIRRKAQAHYSLIKAKRRHDGDFHL
jgi:hypothetical protein